nr:reverse transcriptase domain-containing protein [Tanacetum cinerariifolium]
MSFSPLAYEDDTEGPMIIEAEIGGRFIHRMIIPLKCTMVLGPEAQPFASTRVAKEKSGGNSPEIPRANNSNGFHSNERGLNIREGCAPIKQKRRSQAPERNNTIQEEVERLMEAGIMKEVHYDSWLANPVMQELESIRGRSGDQKPHKTRNNKGYRRNIQDPKRNKHEAESQEMHLRGGRRYVLGIQDKSLSFFKTLKKCTKKSDFQWTAEAKAAFKQMKKLIVELPTLTAPMEKEELIMYPAVAREAVSTFLMTKKEAKQTPIYFVNHPLQGAIKTRNCMKVAKMKHRAGGRGVNRVGFDATNNEAEYEALIAGLRIAKQMGVKNLQTHVDSRLVANQINGSYIAKEPEKREQAAIREARSKEKMEKYYNFKVRNTSFKPRDLVYQNNDASHAEDRGKLGPKWEGPYKVIEALGK